VIPYPEGDFFVEAVGQGRLIHGSTVVMVILVDEARGWFAPAGCEIPHLFSMSGMGEVMREELDVFDLKNIEEGDNFRKLRKRRLTMAPKLDEKSETPLEAMIIEQGIRDGSINWMVVIVTCSWRSDDYSEVLINYFGENVARGEDGVVEMNVNCADGPKDEKSHLA
jgi:hypothetical protein